MTLPRLWMGRAMSLRANGCTLAGTISAGGSSVCFVHHAVRERSDWDRATSRMRRQQGLLDAIARDFGETCYEVPVGFKHISGKMAETGAVIGGESSGGLTVRGHIQGKDGIYAAALLVEMIATTGRRLSEVYREITDKYGKFEMEERDYSFSQTEKERINKLLMTDKLLPEFPYEVEKVSYADGCKVYFKNGGWIICRFSGTEPLLRIFCEMDSMDNAAACTALMERFIDLK